MKSAPRHRPGRAPALLIAAVALVLAPSVRAAGDGPNDDARRLFERGQRHYNVGEFDTAIDEFKRAYELSPAAGLLFNIAQAYRAKKDRDRALYFYTTYLREDPAAPERSYVEARMVELRAEEAQAQPQAQAAATALPSAATTASRADAHVGDTSPGRGLRIGGVATGAAGLALVGTAIVFAIKSGSASDEVSQAFAMGQTWTPHLSEVYADGQRNQTTAWVVGAVGVAALVTGGALYYFGGRERPATLSASASSDGGAVSFRCAF